MLYFHAIEEKERELSWLRTWKYVQFSSFHLIRRAFEKCLQINSKQWIAHQSKNSPKDQFQIFSNFYLICHLHK